MWGARNKQDDEPKYLQLYSLLNNMKNYDKDKLDARFPDNLAAFCKKLAENLFISLRQFHSGKYKSVQIKQLLVDIKYLYERGLHLICHNKLRRVKSMAEDIDDSAALIEINKFERLLYKFIRDGKKPDEEIFDQAKTDKEAILNSLRDEFNYFDIYDELFPLVKEYYVLDEQGQKDLKEKYDESLFYEDKVPENPSAARRFYLTAALYYQLLADETKVLFFFSKVLNWWTTNSVMRDEAYYSYIIDLSNFLGPCLNNRNYNFARKILLELKEIYETLKGKNTQNEHTISLAFQKNFIHWLRYHLSQNEFHEALLLVPKIEAGLKKHKINPRSELVLLYNVTVLYFVFEKFEEAKRWVEKILKHVPSNYRKDIQLAALILNVVLVLEIGDEILTDSIALKKARYNLKKHHGLDKHNFEFKVLELLVKVCRLGLSDRKEHYKAFKEYMDELSSSRPEIAGQTGLEELYYWIRHKIEGKPIIDLIKGDQDD
jgi:hypothetical protein